MSCHFRRLARLHFCAQSRRIGKGVPFKRSSPFADANPPVLINASRDLIASENDELLEEKALKKNDATSDALMRIKFLEETIDRKESQIAELNREIGRLRHILTTHNIDPNAQG